MTTSVTALATKAALVPPSAPSATLIFVDPSFRHSVHVAADAPARSANITADVGTRASPDRRGAPAQARDGVTLRSLSGKPARFHVSINSWCRVRANYNLFPLDELKTRSFPLRETLRNSPTVSG